MMRFILSVTVLMFLALPTFAATSFCDTGGSELEEYESKTHTCSRKTKDTSTGSTTYFEVVEKSGVATERLACTEAVKKYQELQKSGSAFRKGCKATQKISRQREDSLSCLVAANHCELCVGTSEDDEDAPDCQAKDDDEDLDEDDGVNGFGMLRDAIRGKTTTANQNKKSDGELREMKNRFANCPLFSKEDFDEIVETRKKNEEKKKDNKILLEENLAKLKAAERELGDLQREQSKIVPEYTEEFNKIISEQNQKLQDQLTQNGDQLVEMILNMQTAEMQYIDAKNAIYKVCYDKAQAALDRLKANRNLKISTGALRSKGGLAGLTRQTSTEDRLQKYAQGIRNRCKKKDSQVREQIASADRVYEQTIKRLNIQMDKLKSQQQDIADKLIDAKEDPEEKSKLDALKKQYEKRSEDIGKEIAEKMESVGNLNIVVKRINEELQLNNVLYASYLEQESLAKRSGANSDKAITPGEFIEAASEYESALDDAASSCDCSEDGDLEVKNKFNKCKSIFDQMDKDFGNGKDKGTGLQNNRTRESSGNQ